MFTCQSPRNLIDADTLRRCDPFYRGPGCDVAQIETDYLRAEMNRARFEDRKRRRRSTALCQLRRPGVQCTRSSCSRRPGRG